VTVPSERPITPDQKRTGKAGENAQYSCENVYELRPVRYNANETPEYVHQRWKQERREEQRSDLPNPAITANGTI
jgi:hypothetical protein